MEAWLQDWLSLLLRWAHFITGVAWIGASFYFNWLENHLQRRGAAPSDANTISDDAISDDAISDEAIVDHTIADHRIDGDLWAVHGGGFYYLQKYRVAPERLPAPLHWFKYEAYFTWITGFSLLVVVYYWNAELFMLDPRRPDMPVWVAIAIGIGSMVVSWLVYHALCRAFAASHPRATALMIFIGFGALAFALGEFLGGRAAYIHVGAAVGTVMVANVFFVIIPAQKELVQALRERRDPDPAPGREALERSRHNNYLTLPVLFIMISNHYPATYGSQHAMGILIALSLAGVGIRHYFNVRHVPGRGRLTLAASLLLLVAVAAASLPRPAGEGRDAGGIAGAPAEAPATAAILPVVREHCTGCHAATPTFAGIPAPPLGVVLESEAQLELQAERVFQVTVALRTMPPGNVTGMTDQERQRLASWYAGRQNDDDATD